MKKEMKCHMLEYLPWSCKELYNVLKLYRKNIFSILDIELSGACNMACVYCDTPIRTTKTLLDIKLIENLLLIESHQLLE